MYTHTYYIYINICDRLCKNPPCSLIFTKRAVSCKRVSCKSRFLISLYQNNGREFLY